MRQVDQSLDCSKDRVRQVQIVVRRCVDRESLVRCVGQSSQALCASERGSACERGMENV